jgi:hypothetical protein
MPRTTIINEELSNRLQAEKEVKVSRSTPGGYFRSEELCEWQREVGRRGIIEAELVNSMYGWSVRYASGIHNFGLLAGARCRQVDGTREDAERWARNWVAQDPTRRFVTG